MNTKEYTLKVRDFTVLDIALSSEEGEKIYASIKKFIKNVDVLILDFDGIKVLNTAFLNTAIGQLYGDFDSDFLNKHLRINNINRSDLAYLEKAISNAKLYFSNKDMFDESADKILKNE